MHSAQDAEFHFCAPSGSKVRARFATYYLRVPAVNSWRLGHMSNRAITSCLRSIFPLILVRNLGRSRPEVNLPKLIGDLVLGRE
jgi:hypothetical protein